MRGREEELPGWEAHWGGGACDLNSHSGWRGPKENQNCSKDLNKTPPRLAKAGEEFDLCEKEQEWISTSGTAGSRADVIDTVRIRSLPPPPLPSLLCFPLCWLHSQAFSKIEPLAIPGLYPPKSNPRRNTASFPESSRKSPGIRLYWSACVMYTHCLFVFNSFTLLFVSTGFPILEISYTWTHILCNIL